MTDNPIECLMQEFQEFHERIFELACRKSKYAAKMSDSLNKAIEKELEELTILAITTFTVRNLTLP